MAKSRLSTATSEPKKHEGVRAPLFDRLGDERVNQFYKKDEIFASIEREVMALLNTRTALKKEEYEELAAMEENFALPEMYGIPEFSMYDGSSHIQWKNICDTCAKAMAYFEPRLKNIEVSVETFIKEEQSLILTIKANLALGNFQDEVTFPVTVGLVSTT
jgi:type VI secretion system lysozyme-like protein